MRPTSEQVRQALIRRAEENRLRLTVVRTLMLMVVGLWIGLNYGFALVWDSELLIGALILSGLAAFALQQRHPDWQFLPYAFILLDCLLLGYTLLSPGRTYPSEWPWQMVLRQPSFLYFYLMLAVAALSFRPTYMLWTGCCIAGVWALGAYMIIQDPGAVTTLLDEGEAPTDANFLEGYLRPTYVHLDDLAVRLFVTFVVTGILAVGVWQNRKLLYQEVEAARQRSNLSRYVAPQMVDELAATDEPWARVRKQTVAVLFADLRGFTRLSHDMSPEQVVELLRGLHRRLAEAVFAHQGCIDKFMGDGVMVTFGSARARDDDCIRALTCGLAMLDQIRAWNEERRTAGEDLVRIGVGIDAGEAVIGDIGGVDRFEFAVIGDAVNLASRLERMTRDIDVDLIVSDAVVQECAGEPGLRARLKREAPVSVRGLAEPLVVWSARADDASS
ncbi:MAG: adenylate/guanylate cyclase domain-containing protein [Geminicoccaceae bacterium]